MIIQDKRFTTSGALDTSGSGKEFGVLGDTVLINGTYLPYLRATTTRVRLRLLNASNARMYQVGFSDNRPFDVIATDAGLLPAPASVRRVDLSPAERVELVVAIKPGEKLMLHSFGGNIDIDDGEFHLLRLIAADSLTSSPELPTMLPGMADAPLGQSPTIRTFELSWRNEINGQAMDMNRIDTVVPALVREEWHIVNKADAHNFHIHGSEFRVLEIGGKEPPAWMRGPKDTVFVPPHSDVKVAVQFAQYTDPLHPYMYHCHILRHEDKGMMGQFVVVKPGTEGPVALTLPPDVANAPGMDATHSP